MIEHSHLWNDLPIEERRRLMPCMIERQILHYEQCKNKAIRSHRKLMADYNSHINNCRDYLKKEIKELQDE